MKNLQKILIALLLAFFALGTVSATAFAETSDGPIKPVLNDDDEEGDDETEGDDEGDDELQQSDDEDDDEGDDDEDGEGDDDEDGE